MPLKPKKPINIALTFEFDMSALLGLGDPGEFHYIHWSLLSSPVSMHRSELYADLVHSPRSWYHFLFRHHKDDTNGRKAILTPSFLHRGRHLSSDAVKLNLGN
ncbi:hypothetical protein TNCV_3032311 [Trichonephila clavipes]|nr:hypothetical protein TNCV_3032311 [Trichonephila clavipes]